jgi:hypothetical protein
MYSDDDDGCITDGDDVAWLGDKEMLRSSSWRDVARDSVLGKRRREGDSGRHGDSSQIPRLDGLGDAPSTIENSDVHSDDEDEEVSHLLVWR